MNGKTLLYYSDEPNPHGVARYNHSILLALVRAGWRVVSAHPKFDSPMLEEQRNAGVEHIWTSWNWGKQFVRSIVDCAEPERILAAVKPDIVFFSDCWPISSIAAKHAVIARKIPFIVVCHSGDPTLARPYPSCLSIVAKQFDYASAVIAVADSSLQVLRQVYGLPATKGIVIYNGRPPVYFEPAVPSVRSRLRAEIGVPEDGILCLTTARFDAAKGYQFQWDALRRLGRSLQSSKLYFAWIGTGELLPQFEAAIVEMKLGDRVRLLGHRDDVSDWLGAADVFVLTTMNEAMPLSVMEAMAKGLPIVASSVGGIPEELGGTGQLLPNPNTDPSGTATELARILEWWAKSPELRLKSGEAARTRAQLVFREETMVQKTLDTVEDAVTRADLASARSACAVG
jgi:glycosyltransferase involved in cell wall biosynthesis